jgi:hypothetical protein
MGGACSMHEGSIYVYKVWLGRSEGTISLGQLDTEWGIIKPDFKEIG